MDIKIETIYGNVNLISGYDCDSSSYFYDSYDDSGNYLGALWNLPYYDKDDDELIERMKIMIESAEELFKFGETIEVIDCDHDLGDYASDGGDYIRLLDWLEETRQNYPIRIHSQNPVGVDNMRRIIQRNGWKEVF